MVFPTQLTEYLQPAVDKFTFTIDGAIDASVVSIAINGGTDAFDVPCVINLGDELILATTKTSTNLTVCTRGYGSTTAASHLDGAFGYLPLTAEHYEELVEGKDRVIKYLCRTVSSLPVADMVEYEMVEYADEIYIYNGTSWERIGLVLAHDNLKELDSGDPHPAYYTLSELIVAHDADDSDDGHVTGGDDHDHLDGAGVGALDTDLDRLLTSPSYDGEIVLSTTSGVTSVSLNSGGSGYIQDEDLTITGGNTDCTLNIDSVDGSGVVLTVSLLTAGSGYSTSTGSSTTGGTGTLCTIDIDEVTASGTLYTAYSSSWDAVIGAPSGLIMPFDPTNLSSACPDGWSRYTALDGKFVKGTSTSSQTTGGGAHVHTYDSTDVVTHSHSIDAQTIDATDVVNHDHNYYGSGGGSSTGPASVGSVGTYYTSLAGGHSHTGTMVGDSESTGEASPETDSTLSEPPYQKVIWCQKD